MAIKGVESIGKGIVMKIDPELRRLILQVLFEAGRPLSCSSLAVQGVQAMPQPIARLVNTIDVLTRMVHNGDLTTTLGKDGVFSVEGSPWVSDLYYLSAREFVRMSDEANRAAREQASERAGGCIRRFFRRLLRR